MPTTQMVYRLRGVLIAPPYILAAFSFAYETDIPWLTWPLGIFILLLGMALRVWSQCHLHYRLRVKKILTTIGPYSIIRNPIYAGNMLLCLGAMVTSKILWLAPIAFFYCFSIYSLVVRYEEGHLLEKYGEDYRRYMSEVPRWIPRFERTKEVGLRDLGLRNEFLGRSIFAEMQCLLVLLPYIVKEFVSSWMEH